MKSNYDARQAARQARYEELAEKNRREGAALLERSRKLGELIPFGQPILIGHHSEKRDRGFRNRLWNMTGRGIAQGKKGDYYAGKAASVGKAGISSDDPNAIIKLLEKLLGLEIEQEQMKAVNAAHKKYLRDPKSLDKANLTDALKEIVRNYKPQYSWLPHPYAPYELSNNNAQIRRVKGRIEELERQEKKAEAMRAETGGEAVKSQEFAGRLRIEENLEENRVFIFFPGKPSKEIRKACGREGFNWAPTIGAWSRFHSAGAVWSANRVKDLWLKEREEEDKKAAAQALGFASVAEMEEHATWLDQQKAADEKIKQAVEESHTTGVIDLRNVYAD